MTNKQSTTNSNPFNPGFGNVPSLFLERQAEVDKVSAGISTLSAGPYQTTLVYGVRGSGKTAFLNDVCKSFADNKRWIVVYLTSTGNLIEELTSSLINKTESFIGKRLKNLSLNASAYGVSVSAEKGRSSSVTSPKVILEEILQKIAKKNMSLLVAIDEVDSSDAVREYTSIYNALKNQELPIATIMTGLPKSINTLQNDRVLTFLLRSAKIDMTPIDLMTVKFYYKKTFADASRTIDDNTLIKMTRMTKGYPYAFQLLGYLIWETNDKEISDKTISKIIDEYKYMLYKNVYTKIYSDLTNMEKTLVDIIAGSDDDNVSTAELIEKSGKEKGYISTYRKKLIDEQILTSPERGTVSFTLPYFKDYIIENSLIEGIEL